jgi:hypothetical protein
VEHCPAIVYSGRAKGFRLPPVSLDKHQLQTDN